MRHIQVWDWYKSNHRLTWELTVTAAPGHIPLDIWIRLGKESRINKISQNKQTNQNWSETCEQIWACKDTLCQELHPRNLDAISELGFTPEPGLLKAPSMCPSTAQFPTAISQSPLHSTASSAATLLWHSAVRASSAGPLSTVSLSPSEKGCYLSYRH